MIKMNHQITSNKFISNRLMKNYVFDYKFKKNAQIANIKLFSINIKWKEKKMNCPKCNKEALPPTGVVVTKNRLYIPKEPINPFTPEKNYAILTVILSLLIITWFTLQLLKVNLTFNSLQIIYLFI